MNPIRSLNTAVHSLKDHPFAMSLLLMNGIFLAATAFTLHEIAENSRLREAAFHETLRGCLGDKGQTRVPMGQP